MANQALAMPGSLCLVGSDDDHMRGLAAGPAGQAGATSSGVELTDTAGPA